MKCTWIGEQREVPNCGIFKAGDAVDLPDDLTASLLEQGLVAEVKPKAIKEESK